MKCKQCNKKAKFGLNDENYCADHIEVALLQQDYQRYLSVAKANDKGAPNLSFAPYPSKVLIGYANIPDTGYGS